MPQDSFGHQLNQLANDAGVAGSFGCCGRIDLDHQIGTESRVGNRVGQFPAGPPGVVLADDHHALGLALVCLQLVKQFLTNPAAIEACPEFGMVRAGVSRLAGGCEQGLEFMGRHRVNPAKEDHMDLALVGLRHFLGNQLGGRTLVRKCGHSHTTGQTKGRGAESTQEPQAVDAAPHGSSC